MITIVHFSDFHGLPRPLPWADMYISTGDHLPNTKAVLWQLPDLEKQNQDEYIKNNHHKWAAMFGNPDAPIVMVRGNHSFTDEAGLFQAHKGPVHEFKDPDMITVLGIKLGGFRGVPPINNMWADEMSENEIDFRISQLYNLDILITHGPPAGVMDNGYGSKAIAEYIRRQYNPKFTHCFGHVHEANGMRPKNGVNYSNAATSINKFFIT